MKKLRRISALLLAVMLAVVFVGSVHVFGSVQAQIPYTEETKLLADDPAQEEEGDIDVPFEPAKVVKSIRIDTLPAKLEYLQGQALDVSGMVVKATYSNYSTATVTDYEIADYSPDVLGEQTVTVSFGGKTTTFQVTVYAVGDVNGDEAVDGKDATLLLQYAAGWTVDIKALAANVNGDEAVDGKDATLLLQYAAGWSVILGGSTSKTISESAWVWMEKNQTEGYYDVAYIDFTTQHIEQAAYYHEDECPAEYAELTEQIFNGETYLRLGGTWGAFPSFDNETSTTITVYPYEGETCRIDFELIDNDSLKVTYIDQACSEFVYGFKVGTILTRQS